MPREPSIYLTAHSAVAMHPEDLFPDYEPGDLITTADVAAMLDEHGIENVLSWFSFVSSDIDVHVDNGGQTALDLDTTAQGSEEG